MIEIERKYLTVNDQYISLSTDALHIAQGYLSNDPGRVVRVRTVNDRGFITVKGLNRGATRSEWEYEIPVQDAREMLQLCPRVLKKVRYIVPFADKKWEVDAFEGNLKGLVIAEIELNSEDEHYMLPPFVGVEVTDNPKYYNSNLAATC